MMFAEMDNPKKIMLASFVIFLIGTIIHCILMNTAVIDEVQKDYFPVAEAMFTGHTPYHHYNDLAWEYPPLALVVMLIPRVFASTPYGYQISFDVMMMLFAFFESYLVYRAVREKENAVIISIANLVLMTMMIIDGSVLERFDIVPAVICLAAVILYLDERYTWAFVLVAIGSLVKIYPALLFLAFIIPFIVKKDWKNTARMTSVTAAVGLAVMAVFYVICSNELMNFITYHSDRGLQIESVAGSFIDIFAAVGWTEVSTVITFGSCNIVGNLPDMMSPIVMPLLVIMILLACAFQFLACKKDKADMVFFSMLYVMVFMIFNKVFSGQYIMWIVPMVVLFFITREWDDSSWVSFGLITSATIMTMVIMSLPLYRMETGAMLLVFIRNMVFLALLIYVVKHFADENGLFKPVFEKPNETHRIRARRP